jgi:hypothetical protein
VVDVTVLPMLSTNAYVARSPAGTLPMEADNSVWCAAERSCRKAGTVRASIWRGR